MSLQQEKALYPFLEDLFHRRGYMVLNEFGVKVHGATKKTDVAAFKWTSEGEIEANAIECKLPSKGEKDWEGVGKALAQATAYQRFFSKVYIASVAEESELKHIESLLRQLGIGYVTVKDNRAEEVFPPSQNIRFNQIEFDQQVKVKAMTMLAYKDVFQKENIKWGRAARPREIWVSELGLETCNIFTHVYPSKVHVGLNLEKTSAVKKVFTHMSAQEIFNNLSKLPTTYSVLLWKYKGLKVHGHDELFKKMDLAALNVKGVEDLVNSIKQHAWQVDFQVVIETPIQDYRRQLRQDLATQLNEVRRDIYSLHDCFLRILSSDS